MNITISLLCGTLVTSIVPVLAQERSSDADLLQSIQQSDLNLTRRLITAGANVNVKDKAGTTALMYAAAYSNAECMRLLLSSGAAANAANNAAATALMWSAGDFAKVRLLLAKGADVNARANSGRTPLMIAASYTANLATVRLLLSKGAQVRISAPTGGPVFAAANIGDEALIQALVRAGGDPNERDGIGRTPLVVASQFGRIEPVIALLKAGARVNDQSGRLPLAKVGLQELGEQTALMVAAATGNSRLVKLLIDHGAHVNVKDMRGMTPLMMAASSEAQDAETIQLLLAKNADPHTKANDGETAISWASKWGRTGIAKLLAPIIRCRRAADTCNPE